MKKFYRGSNFGECKFCNIMTKLIRGHIIPKSIEGDIYDESGRTLLISNGEIYLEQSGFWAYSWCRDCEDKFQKVDQVVSKVLNNPVIIDNNSVNEWHYQIWNVEQWQYLYAFVCSIFLRGWAHLQWKRENDKTFENIETYCHIPPIKHINNLWSYMLDVENIIPKYPIYFWSLDGPLGPASPSFKKIKNFHHWYMTSYNYMFIMEISSNLDIKNNPLYITNENIIVPTIKTINLPFVRNIILDTKKDFEALENKGILK